MTPALRSRTYIKADTGVGRGCFKSGGNGCFISVVMVCWLLEVGDKVVMVVRGRLLGLNGCYLSFVRF